MVKLSEIETGKEFTFSVGPEEREWYKAYAKASGDKNLIHTNDDFAKKVGLKGVISHGMLSFGIMGKFISNLAGNGRIIEYSGEMRGMVRPGDDLLMKATVDSIMGNIVTFKLEQISKTKIKIVKDGNIVKSFEAEEAGWISEKDISKGLVKTEETPEGTLSYRERLATPGKTVIEMSD